LTACTDVNTRYLPVPAPACGPLPLALGLCAGTALQLQQSTLWAFLTYALLAALGGTGLLARSWLPRPRLLRGVAGAMVGVGLLAALLGWGLTGARAVVFASGALPPALEDRDLQVEGVVASPPQATEYGLRLVFDIDAVIAGADAHAVPARVLLAWNGVRGPGASARAWPDADSMPASRTTVVPMAGERWRIVVRLRAPHGLFNPHGVDAELGWWERGIQALGTVRQGQANPPPQRLAEAGMLSLSRARQHVRDAILAQASGLAGPANAGVVAALVVGDPQAITPAQWDLYRDTGIAHLVSISGLHVTAFAWVAAAAVGQVWRRSRRLCLTCPAPTAGLIAGVLLATAYAVFSGWAVPAQRTVWMLATLALLRSQGARWPWPVSWACVAAVVALLDPWALLQPGFWLSFVAVAILFAQAATQPLPGWSGRLFSLAREQARITLGLAPLTLLLFGECSVVGLLANLVAIPWVTLLVLPLSMAGLLVPPAWTLAALAMGGLGWLLQALASLPGGVVQVAAAPAWMAAGALAGAAWAVLPLPIALRLPGLLLIVPLLGWQPPRPPEGHLHLLAVDIGQGSAVLLRTARHDLLYDAGPRWSADQDAGQRVLVPLLRSLGVRLDRLVISHQDLDHSGGAAAVLAAHPGASLLASLDAGHPLAALRAPQVCLAGQRWRWDGVDFEVLHPDEDLLAAPAPGLRPNAVSCVLRVTAAGQRALLAGDIERAQEWRLLERQGPEALRADVLLVPHHGSKTSSSVAFLEAVQPRIALVQAAYRNRYGHPAPGVMARYAERGIAVVASPACGAAHWSSHEPGQVQCERQRRPRYWHHRLE
jgi:competence protein ComEC